MTSLRLAAIISVACALAPAPRPLPGRRRGATITKAIDDYISDAVRAFQDFSDVAAPIVKSGVDAAAPIVKAGADAAAPVVKQGLSKTAEAAASGLSAAERAALTEEQIRQLAKAGQVAGQVGDVAGYVGRGALKAGKGVVDAAVPYVEPSARLVGRAANDLLDKQSLSEGTRAALADLLCQSSSDGGSGPGIDNTCGVICTETVHNCCYCRFQLGHALPYSVNRMAMILQHHLKGS